MHGLPPSFDRDAGFNLKLKSIKVMENISPIIPVTSDNLPALQDNPIIQLCNVSSISRIKITTLEYERKHVRFFVRMSNKDVFTVSVKLMDNELVDNAVDYMKQQRCDLAGMLMQGEAKAVAFVGGVFGGVV